MNGLTNAHRAINVQWEEIAAKPCRRGSGAGKRVLSDCDGRHVLYVNVHLVAKVPKPAIHNLDERCEWFAVDIEEGRKRTKR
eukprot:2819615-Pyramimonas_sp.AAC.1